MKPLSVLHLLEPADGEDAVIACRAALDIPGVDHALWIIGNDADARFARERGVESPDRITPMLRTPETAVRRAANLFNHRYWGGHAPLETPDLIMCWSIGCMGLSRLIVGKRGVMRCGLLLRDRLAPRRGTLAFRREAYALADVTTVALSERIRAAHAQAASVGRGGTFLKDNIRLFDPPIPPTRPALSPADRLDLRRRLGVPDNHHLIALLADPPRAGDAKRFTFFLGLLYAGHQRVSGLIPSGCQRLGRASRYLRDHDRRWGLIASDLPLETRLAVSDAAIVLPAEHSGSACTAPSTGPVSIAAALAAGVPVFSTDAAVDRALLDGPDAAQPSLSAHCLATDFGHDGLLNRIAARLAPALHDPAHFAHLRDRALARAQTMRQADAFRADLLALWREIANVPIIRPGLPVPPSLTKTSLAAAS
ncbi:MAG: hypothetical protein KF768_08065 [Phycisphaeraceae bacterium]|nr:hypothetical protein [Phycisphaeraceae bacterium]